MVKGYFYHSLGYWIAYHIDNDVYDNEGKWIGYITENCRDIANSEGEYICSISDKNRLYYYRDKKSIKFEKSTRKTDQKANNEFPGYAGRILLTQEAEDVTFGGNRYLIEVYNTDIVKAKKHYFKYVWPHLRISYYANEYKKTITYKKLVKTINPENILKQLPEIGFNVLLGVKAGYRRRILCGNDFQLIWELILLKIEAISKLIELNKDKKTIEKEIEILTNAKITEVEMILRKHKPERMKKLIQERRGNKRKIVPKEILERILEKKRHSEKSITQINMEVANEYNKKAKKQYTISASLIRNIFKDHSDCFPTLKDSNYIPSSDIEKALTKKMIEQFYPNYLKKMSK